MKLSGELFVTLIEKLVKYRHERCGRNERISVLLGGV
jgi:hypothetical protein